MMPNNLLQGGLVCLAMIRIQAVVATGPTRSPLQSAVWAVLQICRSLNNLQTRCARKSRPFDLRHIGHQPKLVRGQVVGQGLPLALRAGCSKIQLRTSRTFTERRHALCLVCKSSARQKATTRYQSDRLGNEGYDCLGYGASVFGFHIERSRRASAR